MSSSAQETLAALTKLKETLSGDVVCPGEEGYEYGIARWSDNCVKQAGYVVFPETNEDVAEAVKFARGQSLELAICGGGHSYSVSSRELVLRTRRLTYSVLQGSSSTQGGVVIHLGKYMNDARCDPEKRLLYVGGGATWAIGTWPLPCHSSSWNAP